MLNFMLGSFLGGTVGVITMCLCFVAKESDKFMDSEN